MKRKTHSIVILALVIIALGVISFSLEQNTKKNQTALSFFQDTLLTDAFPKVTRKDRAPINIPNETKKRGNTIKLPILMYHHVGNLPPDLPKSDRLRAGLTVSSAIFDSQLGWIKEQGFTSITLEDLYLFSQGKKILPKKPIIFTFDDGYDDVFINAIPILKKYGYSGSFGIITQWPGWQSGTNTYATWEQIALAKEQGMEIVCHTQNHFDGTDKKFNSNYIYNNLEGCVNDLKNHFGIDNHILIYPYGHYNSVYVEQAQKIGFRLGVTVHEGSTINLENLMEIPRIRVGNSLNFEVFKKLLTQ